MSDSVFDPIAAAEALEANLRELVTVGGLRPGNILVIGTSTSEILGHQIGTSSTLNAAKPIFETVARICGEFGLHAAYQCCEHLNRALIVEEELLALAPQLEPVSVIPVPKAGGSMASYAYRHFLKPVVVETIQAHAGIDIGSTLIGMHLRRVAVPVRPLVRHIGQAYVTMAFTRPKLIGGTRAVYSADLADQLYQQAAPDADC
ncbi:TIGR01440 family protein [Paenibacillus sp. LjRoot56]|uniref:TIGR01440 family protein n=1 Tax=Paenibacillus sp. LjRoot56 TaxID=3342333 RepID=UPI003ED14AAA